jgi:hypothetical protein
MNRTALDLRNREAKDLIRSPIIHSEGSYDFLCPTGMMRSGSWSWCSFATQMTSRS